MFSFRGTVLMQVVALLRFKIKVTNLVDGRET